MELPDESVSFNLHGLLAPASEEWTANAELRASNLINPGRYKDLQQRLLQCRSQVAADLADPVHADRLSDHGLVSHVVTIASRECCGDAGECRITLSIGIHEVLHRCRVPPRVGSPVGFGSG